MSSSTKKPFWHYIKAKRQDRVGISTLKTFDGQVTTDPLEKANILNHHFKSVFINENYTNFPSNYKTNSLSIFEITMHTGSIQHLTEL